MPDAPLLTRFKQNFEPYIELMFEQMVDYTEPICQMIDSELAVEKKTDSPDEDKSVSDASSLVPVLSDFFFLHPGFHPDTLLGDSSFDSAVLYGSLLNGFHFSRALIPYNPVTKVP